jgi:hypothetical protein
MKSTIAKSVLLGAALSSTSFLSIAQSIVYDNSTTTDTGQFYSSANEFGDEITLAGTARTLFNISFSYYYNGAAPGNITLRLYDNSGATPPGSPGAPLLATPSVFTLGTTDPLNGNRGTFSWDLSSASPTVTVPDTFTWTIQFSGLSGGSTAGLLLYGPPTVGTSPTDFWENSGGTWATLGVTGQPSVDFAARVTAVPEPGTLALGALALLIGGGVARYRKLRQ